jgi:monovalent cation:H+ antiporter-2, CPA2 family
VETIPLLQELALIAALSVAVTLLLSRLRLPAVAGLLLAGALAGPHGLALVTSTHEIEILAEVGVVLLLFSIGLEFSLERLRKIFRQVVIGGMLQVGLTITATIVAALSLGQTLSRGIFFGFVFAMSSTAIVLRALAERRELDAPHGRFIVGALIFQDLCVVPMVLIVPILGSGSSAGSEIGLALLKAALVVVVTLAVARVAAPRLLGLVDASRSREIFLLAVLSICIGTAWLTSLVGLSLALGAFIAGIVVAGTEYGHRALGDVLPLRDAFVSIFFVSLGMLFEPAVVLDEPWAVSVFFSGFLVGKGFIATLAALAMRFPARVAWLAGVGLAQFGEFGFVLAALGRESGVISDPAVRAMFAGGILSMFITPLLVRLAPHVTAGERILGPLAKLIGVRSIDEPDATTDALADHTVIVGFGVAGRMLARALSACRLPYVVIELNAETVRRSRAEGKPVFYGDATSSEALTHAHVEAAKVVVLLMSDPEGTQRVIASIRRLAPRVRVITRARYELETSQLRQLGADDVVVEEVEAGVEMTSRVLRSCERGEDVIDAVTQSLRSSTEPSSRRPADAPH